MAFDKQLADEILKIAREKFPEKIADLRHLKELTGTTLRDFVNLSVTPKGRTTDVI